MRKALCVGIDSYSKRHKYFLFTFQIFLSKIILR